MMNMNKRLCAILLMTAMTVMAVAQTAQELLNDANAKYEAGQMDAALELYTQAANKGLAEAQYQLGKMYYLGESTNWVRCTIWVRVGQKTIARHPCGSSVLHDNAMLRLNTDWPPAI